MTLLHAAACALPCGGALGETGGSAPAVGFVVEFELPESPAPLRAPIASATMMTSGTVTAVAMSAARLRSGSICCVRSKVHDRAGQRASDALDRLHVGDHELAEFVHAACFGADDDIVGTGHVLGAGHPGEGAYLLGHRGCLAHFGLDQDVRTNRHRYVSRLTRRRTGRT